MKHNNLYQILAICALAVTTFLASGCLRDECTTTQTYILYEPIYKSPAEIRTGVSVSGPRAMKNPGKFYALGNYMFVNEYQEGIHVIDNSNPENPRNIAFWNITGNVDMAIKGNMLYADQYVDLLTIDIADFNNPQLVCRREGAFNLFGFDPARGFLVDYNKTSVTEELKCDDPRLGQRWFRGNNGGVFIDAVFDSNFSGTGGPRRSSASGGQTVGAATGIAGSYARFGLYKDFLYTVDNTTLVSWDVKNGCASRLEATSVGWNIETIFPWKDRLFIGSQTGVFIFNNSNPVRPVLEQAFSHASGCDPVVCDDTHAYVTIHDGTTCNGTFNQLDVINISNLPSIRLEKIYQMKKPKGLSLAGKYLYLCDDGLKIYDRTDPQDLKLLSHTKDIDTYDVIALDDTHILITGQDGFIQYDVSNPEKPRRISIIAVQK
jgi:hypothetical protein